MINLLPQHQSLVYVESGISAEVAQQRQYRSIQSAHELTALGFADYQCRVPGLPIPTWNVDREVATYHLRPDGPRCNQAGKRIKYETPAGAHLVIDVPPSVQPRLADPAVPLLITEGERKADSAVSAGACCIDLLGVWGWRGTNQYRGKTALPDWHSIALNQRAVYIALDTDVMSNPKVRSALDELGAFLKRKGARVRYCDLSRGDAHG